MLGHIYNCTHFLRVAEGVRVCVQPKCCVWCYIKRGALNQHKHASIAAAAALVAFASVSCLGACARIGHSHRFGFGSQMHATVHSARMRSYVRARENREIGANPLSFDYRC